MKSLQTKPNRTFGIMMVVAVVVILISGLAPSQDYPEELTVKWETETGQSDTGASSANVADMNGDGGPRFVLSGFGFVSDRSW